MLPIYDSQYILLVIINRILKKIVEVELDFNDFFSSENFASLETSMYRASPRTRKTVNSNFVNSWSILSKELIIFQNRQE